jgi:hypothetical protein
MTEQRRTRRCAIYTRKSSEEGLDQSFNSLEAQRAGGEAFSITGVLNMIAIQMNDDHRTPGTPLPLDFEPARVPTMLATLRRWVCWKWFLDAKSKWTKVPIDPATSQPGNVTSPAVWHSLDEAFAVARASEGAFGIGFVVTLDLGVVGIDLDGCIDADGVVLPEALEIVRSFDSYTEFTPSGTGLRIFVEASKPAFAKCKRNKAFGMKCVEVYETDRYFTFTGRHWDGTPSQVMPRQEQLDGLCLTLWPWSTPNSWSWTPPHVAAWKRPRRGSPRPGGVWVRRGGGSARS